MLQWDTKYLLFLLFLPCWWLLQEAKVNQKHKWSSLLFRRNWMQLHPRCPGTRGSPCPPVSTPSRQRTSRKSAYSSRLIFSFLKIKTLVHSELCFCSILYVYSTFPGTIFKLGHFYLFFSGFASLMLGEL